MLKAGSKGYLVAGLFSSLAIYSVLFALLTLKVSVVNTLTSLEALFTIIIIWLLFKQTDLITRNLVFGTFVVIIGVAVVILF